MRDFTFKRYCDLIGTFLDAGYNFQTFADSIEHPTNSALILRHDVDKLPYNSLHFSKFQSDNGIQGTYYFRISPQSFNEEVIKEIASLGHEIGYHYETLDSANGNVEKAYDQFCRNLEEFRKIVKIKTISMHGSPISRFDNREIWKKFDYKKLGIIGEPYFDIDFNELFYLTDTGRSWDGHLYNIRDKATKDNPVTNLDFLNLQFRNTNKIITSVKSGEFPRAAMLNFHPQRWNDNPLLWMKELLWQNIKNKGKRILINLRDI